jgi:hypothetical protein
MQAGAYEKVIAIKLVSSLKRHLSEDSSRDSPFLRGVSAAESRRRSSGGNGYRIGADEGHVHIYIVKVSI